MCIIYLYNYIYICEDKYKNIIAYVYFLINLLNHRLRSFALRWIKMGSCRRDQSSAQATEVTPWQLGPDVMSMLPKRPGQGCMARSWVGYGFGVATSEVRLI
jgi:hypothetical protein